MTEISLGFDIIVILMLGATIFYAVRLSRHLDSFRSNRADMEQLIRELSTQIMRAQEGITVLDDLASTKGDQLRKYIDKAQGLSDELEIMIGSGNSLAERLENLASRNREIASAMEQTAVDLTYPGQAKAPELKASRQARYEDTLSRTIVPPVEAERPASPFFAIRDPDFDANNAGDADDSLQSQAERDLADALKRRGKK